MLLMVEKKTFYNWFAHGDTVQFDIVLGGKYFQEAVNTTGFKDKRIQGCVNTNFVIMHKYMANLLVRHRAKPIGKKILITKHKYFASILVHQ